MGCTEIMRTDPSIEKDAQAGFLFLNECDVTTLPPPYASLKETTMENRWLDLKCRGKNDDDERPLTTTTTKATCSADSEATCSQCHVVLRPFHTELAADGCVFGLEGAPPRFDGTIDDSRPDVKLCTCQIRRKQRSDAALLLGLALSCEEMGHIQIKSSRVILRDPSDRESSLPSPSSSSQPSSTYNPVGASASIRTAAIFISFSVPITTTQKTSAKRRQHSRRRFISNSSKPLPPATQLLLSLMRSDWETIEVLMRHPEKIWGIESRRRRLRAPRLPYFPPKISLEEVYHRIGGAASVLEEEPSQPTNNASSTSKTTTRTLQSLPNDILVDQISGYLRAGSLEALRRTCKQLHFRLRSVVPGLKLRLYAHQTKSLSWMRLRETRALTESDFAIESSSNLPTLGTDHDAHRAASGGASVVLSARSRGSGTKDNQKDVRISQYNGDEIIVQANDPLARRFARGGLLCDDPGLGKTITVVALVLQTMGLSTVPSERKLEGNQNETDRKVSAEERIFVEYWREQVADGFRAGVLHKLVNSFLRANRDADIFVSPVDPELHECPDYYEVITTPICFQDIKRKIDNGSYADSFSAFQKDAELCFSNAMEYNQEGTEVYNAARRMRDVFSKVVEEFKSLQVRLAKKSFGRALAKPNSAVAALVEQNKTLKLKSSLVSSSATLLVVPSVLLEHWEAQLNLHVDLAFCTNLAPIVFEYSGKAESGLRMEEILIQCKVRKTHFPFLFIDKTTTKKLPSPDFLAMFSIVITTNQRFSNEWRNGSFEEEMKRESADTLDKGDYEFYSNVSQSEEACALLKVDWLRMVVDEGHSMGRGRDNSAISFASWVEAERRWAMTGTPTRQTSAQSGLSSIMNLMQYLKHDFFSRRQDGVVVWQSHIARGWNKGLLCSFYRLRSLLKLLMVRHTKRDIEELQPPEYQTTTLDMSPEEVKTYNTLVCAVQSNLIITSMKGKTSGLQDSLLHRSQGKHARDAMRNVRLVCSGGTQVVPTLTAKFWDEFIRDLKICNPTPDKLDEVKRYLSRAVTEQLSPCGCCGIMLTTLLVFPCGDLVCTECVNGNSSVCVVCEKKFDVDVFQRLQPGLDYQWLHNIEEEAKKKKAKAIKPEQEESEELLQLPSDGAGMLAPIDESQRQRRRARKPGDGHQCVYCAKRADGTCELCWKAHDSCNLVTKSGKCEVCHLKAESCPNSETKPSYVIRKLLDLHKADKKIKDGRRHVSDKVVKSEGFRPHETRPLKVIVFSQFRKVLNTIGDRLLRRFGTACVAEYWGKYRKQELHKFVYEETCFCMLLGKDGSEGLDLSFVTHIFFIEQVWDKSLQQQAVSRAYRMGAKGSVFVETLIAASSVEETMFRLESVLEDEHDASKETNEIHTVQLATLSTKDTDYQRAKLQFLLKSLKLISNASTSSFAAVKRQLPTAIPESDMKPNAKRRKVVKGRVRFKDESS